MKAEQHSKLWGQIVAKAWQDESLKKRLLADPAAVLKEYGIEVPPGVQLRVVENTDQILHLTLPSKPTRELSENELERVAAGGIWGAVLIGAVEGSVLQMNRQFQAAGIVVPEVVPNIK